MINPVRTAIASYGMSGQVFHGPLLSVNKRFNVVSVFERTKNLSAPLFGENRIVRSFDEILSNRDVELVIVNTPDHLHAEMAKAVLESGKHVVVEKPFTLKSPDAWDLIRLAGEKQLLLTVYQNRRWDGDFLTIKKVIGEGLTGRLAEFESHFDRYRNFIASGTWKEDDSNSGGLLFNLGSHMVDQAYVLFGEPRSVTAHLRKIRTDTRIVDYYDIRLQYEGFSALLKCSYLVREEGPRYIIHGTEGSFIKNGIDPQEEELKKGRLPAGDDWGKEPESQWGVLNTQVRGLHFRGKIETLPGNYNAFYDNIYMVLRKNADPEVKPAEAAHVIEILEACRLSSQLQKTVVLR